MDEDRLQDKLQVTVIDLNTMTVVVSQKPIASSTRSWMSLLFVEMDAKHHPGKVRVMWDDHESRLSIAYRLYVLRTGIQELTHNTTATSDIHAVVDSLCMTERGGGGIRLFAEDRTSFHGDASSIKRIRASTGHECPALQMPSLNSSEVIVKLLEEDELAGDSEEVHVCWPQSQSGGTLLRFEESCCFSIGRLEWQTLTPEFRCSYYNFSPEVTTSDNDSFVPKHDGDSSGSKRIPSNTNNTLDCLPSPSKRSK